MWDEMHRLGVSQLGGAPPRIPEGTLRELRDDPLRRIVLAEVREHLLPEVMRKLVAVADPRGRVIFAHGGDDARARAEHVGLTEGVVWTCPTGGTNGIGLVSWHRRAVQCLAQMHWRVEQFNLVCDVVPVWYRKRMVAVLNLTGDVAGASDDTLPMLTFFARQVQDRLAQADRDAAARRWAAGQLLDRCAAPALVMREGVVIAAREMRLEPGDPVEFRGRPAPGLMWHDQLGFVLLEPLPYENTWLVRSVSRQDRSPMRVIFDFVDRHNPVVRIRGTVAEADCPISRPQHVRVLTALYRNRAGMTAQDLSGALYGEPGRTGSVRPLISRLRDEVWWLLEPRGYRLGEQLDIELRERGGSVGGVAE